MLESKRLPREMKFNSAIEKKIQTLFRLHAKPKIWSRWHPLGPVVGNAQLTISVVSETLGDTGFQAVVRYFDINNRRQFLNVALFGTAKIQVGPKSVPPIMQEPAIRVRSTTITGHTIRIQASTTRPIR